MIGDKRMIKNCNLIVGYNLRIWEQFGEREDICIDNSSGENRHLILCGMSGSGKSYCLQAIFAKKYLANPDGEYVLLDFKRADSFEHLRSCKHYYSYEKTIEGFEYVYTRLRKRLLGEDTTKNDILCIWDEYVSNVIELINKDKKYASKIMNMVSELLILGRELNVILWIASPRSDSIVFPLGSRLNFGYILILGGPNMSICEMLIPDFMDAIKGQRFERGEGVLLSQGNKLDYIKIPVVRDEKRMKALCIKALS